MKLRRAVWSWLLALGPTVLAVAAPGDEAALVAEMNAAIEQVKTIVNQPVTPLPRAPDIPVRVFRPGWFHEGAARPDFLTVDVGATQQFPYGDSGYVTSDLNPGVMFQASELEFNPMTKYFYTDRSLPKKRLRPDEMEELNRLYRVIGARQQDLARLRAEPTAAAAPADEPSRAPVAYAAGAALLVLAAAVAYRRRARA